MGSDNEEEELEVERDPRLLAELPADLFGLLVRLLAVLAVLCSCRSVRERFRSSAFRSVWQQLADRSRAELPFTGLTLFACGHHPPGDTDEALCTRCGADERERAKANEQRNRTIVEFDNRIVRQGVSYSIHGVALDCEFAHSRWHNALAD